MSALVVKASSALMRSGVTISARRVAAARYNGQTRNRKRRGGGGSGRRKYEAKLNLIIKHDLIGRLRMMQSDVYSL
ncbi:unnamed protein product, partial [Brassica oleracea]